ncbi:MAG: hypothetical protein HYY24_07020 [Verrucomicrobia bacterium]|nr:hypothetical protein [Verrucomicrobiota bacterium]
MRCDRAGNLWICSPKEGLLVLSADGARYQLYTEAEGLTRREVQVSYEDREDNTWVGGWRGGLDRLRKPPFHSIAAAAGIGSENIYSLAPASGGGVWIGTHGRGTYLWQQGKTYLHNGSGPRSWSVMEDRTGALWNGNYNGELRRLTPGAMERFFSAEAGKHAHTFSLFEDRSGRVWAGGEWGLSCYDHGTMRDYLPPQFAKEQFEWVNSLAEDSDSAIWLGTKLGFLHRFRNGEFSTLLKPDKDTQFPVCALHFHRPGELWMARFGFGLSRLKDGQFTDYTPAQGLPTSTINGILDDGRGFLWMTSKQGVFRISKTDFDLFAEHHTAGVRWERFTQKDGLPSVGCQGEQNKPSLCQTPDGRIWVPTIAGIGVIDPATLTEPVPPAKALIEQVRLYRAGSPPQTMLAEGEFNPLTPQRLTVPAGRKNLVIHYTGIDLTDPKKVRFKHRLTGLDHDWVEAGPGRTAIFAALRPGAYQFELIAINHRSIPSPPATLALQVLPTWWETWTFRAVVAAVFLLSGPIFYARRIKHLNRERAKQAEFTRRLIAREEAERKRIAHEIHDVLGHDLLLLKNSAAQGAAATGDPQEQFDLISALATRTLEESRAITYRLRPVELERLGFNHALEAMIAKVAATAGLQVFKEVDDLAGVLSAELQLYVYRLVQEGFNNVLKHARASTVMLEVKRDGDQVRVRLEDNGVGFDPAAPARAQSGGLGLAGIEERVKLIGGTFHLASVPSQGTRLHITVPLTPPPV